MECLGHVSGDREAYIKIFIFSVEVIVLSAYRTWCLARNSAIGVSLQRKLMEFVDRVSPTLKAMRQDARGDH